MKTCLINLSTSNLIQVLKECHSLACGLRAPGYPSSVSCNLAAIEFKDLIHVTQIFSDLFLIWHIDVDRDPTCCRQVFPEKKSSFEQYRWS